MKLKDFERHIGVKFKKRRLLRQALTHRSFINENLDKGFEDNERLEFLGDAVLDFLTAEMLYSRFPDMSEGVMTRLRSALVRTESLAKLAIDCRVGEVIYMGKGEDRTGGRERTIILCSTFEALVGAIYLDRGLNAVKTFVIPKLTVLQDEVWDEAIHKDVRSQFQEWSQAMLNITPQYETVTTTGPDHKKEFQVELLLQDDVVATGLGKTKQLASHDAARQALQRVENNDFAEQVAEAAARREAELEAQRLLAELEAEVIEPEIQADEAE